MHNNWLKRVLNFEGMDWICHLLYYLEVVVSSLLGWITSTHDLSEKSCKSVWKSHRWDQLFWIQKEQVEIDWSIISVCIWKTVLHLDVRKWSFRLSIQWEDLGNELSGWFSFVFAYKEVQMRPLHFIWVFFWLHGTHSWKLHSYSDKWEITNLSL